MTGDKELDAINAMLNAATHTISSSTLRVTHDYDAALSGIQVPAMTDVPTAKDWAPQRAGDPVPPEYRNDLYMMEKPLSEGIRLYVKHGIIPESLIPLVSVPKPVTELKIPGITIENVRISYSGEDGEENRKAYVNIDQYLMRLSQQFDLAFSQEHVSEVTVYDGQDMRIYALLPTAIVFGPTNMKLLNIVPLAFEVNRPGFDPINEMVRAAGQMAICAEMHRLRYYAVDREGISHIAMNVGGVISGDRNYMMDDGYPRAMQLMEAALKARFSAIQYAMVLGLDDVYSMGVGHIALLANLAWFDTDTDLARTYGDMPKKVIHGFRMPSVQSLQGLIDNQITQLDEMRTQHLHGGSPYTG